jgi:hypothetical protein
MPRSGSAQDGPTFALHCGGVQGQHVHGEAEAESKACLDLPALELKSSSERKGILPGRGEAARGTK